MTVLDTFEGWQAGEVEPHAALRELCMDYAELEREVETLHRERATLGAQISRIVAALGDRVLVSGFGELRLAPPTTTVSYDPRQTDLLVRQLVAHGFCGIAHRLRACRHEVVEPGTLRVTRQRRARP